jgi:hypothetical protein
MSPRVNNSKKVKISPQFRARLNKLKPEQKVRAILLLRTSGTESQASQVRARRTRQLIIKSIRQAAKTALPDIDETLKRFDGKRLASKVNALGAIPVETTAAGLTALENSEYVKVILEDQGVSLLARLKRA